MCFAGVRAVHFRCWWADQPHCAGAHGRANTAFLQRLPPCTWSANHTYSSIKPVFVIFFWRCRYEFQFDCTPVIFGRGPFMQDSVKKRQHLGFPTVYMWLGYCSFIPKFFARCVFFFLCASARNHRSVLEYGFFKKQWILDLVLATKLFLFHRNESNYNKLCSCKPWHAEIISHFQVLWRSHSLHSQIIWFVYLCVLLINQCHRYILERHMPSQLDRFR